MGFAYGGPSRPSKALARTGAGAFVPGRGRQRQCLSRGRAAAEASVPGGIDAGTYRDRNVTFVAGAAACVTKRFGASPYVTYDGSECWRVTLRSPEGGRVGGRFRERAVQVGRVSGRTTTVGKAATAVSGRPDKRTGTKRHLVDIDEHALGDAKRELGTRTVKDTVNLALRRAGTQRRDEVERQFDVLARADLAPREQAWP